MLRNKGLIVRSPIKQKTSIARAGQCKFIESYDLEVDRQQRAEEEAKANELPHPIENEN